MMGNITYLSFLLFYMCVITHHYHVYQFFGIY